jgi:aerobic carbon-monoxide dehydrogenase large subunit
MRAGIGNSVRRKEDGRLPTGLGRYSDDFNLPGQVFGAVLRSPHAHARIRAIDTKAAHAMPGVLAILTGADAAADGLTPIPHLTAPGTPPDIVLHNRDGSAVPVVPHHVLSTDRARHVGAAVVFVMLTQACTRGQRVSASARSLKRWILPVAVFGSSLRNSSQRGYLYGASFSRQ